MVYPYLGVFAHGLGVGLPELSRAFALRSVAGGLSPFLAFIADSRGRRVGMLFGLGLIAVAAGILAFKPIYIIFVSCLILATVGYHIFVPSMQAYLGDEVPYRRRGLVLAITELGWSISFILGVPLVGFMIAHFGWASPFPLLALLAFLSLVFLVRLLPADPVTAENYGGIRSSLIAILTSPVALAGLAVSIAITSANEVVNLVFGLWLNDSFGLQVTALGAVSIGIGLAELGGEILVGGFVDRLGKLSSISGGLGLNCLAALGVIFLGKNQFGAIASLIVFYLTFEFTLVSSLPLMTELLPKARASLMAVNIAMFAMGRAVGAGLGGWLYTLSPQNLPPVSSNAMAAIIFNMFALLALYFLRRWWNPQAAQSSI